MNSLAEKTNLFVDKMLPDLLGHLCRTDRAPEYALQKWTKILSDNISASSPLSITDQGRKNIAVSGIDKIFESNKEKWAQLIKEKIKGSATK